MRLDELTRPTVPTTYALLMTDVAASLGVPRARLLAAADVPAELLDDPHGRISVVEVASLLHHAISLTDEPAIGYEFGLRTSLTSHGLIGYGLMSSETLRDAIELGAQFVSTRVPVLAIELFTDGDHAVIEAAETVPLGDLRQPVFDLFLVGLARMAPVLTEQRFGLADVELWFDREEPEYFARFRSRLPPSRFGTGANQVRFRADLLDRRPDTANRVTAELVAQQCRLELEQLGLSGDVVGQVRAILQASVGDAPDVATIAELLHTSPRTLKRRLREHSTNFQQIADSVRRAEALRLVDTTALTAEQIAARLGYADARAFRRAFRAWTGTTPASRRDPRAD